MPKRVLLIATVQSHIGQFHKPLMRMLRDNGWEIHVAARDNLAEKNGLQLEYPDKVFDIPFRRSPFDPRNLKAYCMLKKTLRDEHYDVIHCNTPVGGVLGRLAASPYRNKGTQVFYTAHGFHFYEGASTKNWILYYPIEKLLSKITDKLITINDEDYRFAKRKLNCEVHRIHGIGADDRRFHPLGKAEVNSLRDGMGLKGPVLLIVGELLPNKNQRTAVLAMKTIIESFPEASLLIAGNGPEEDSLKKLIEYEGLSDNIRMLGYKTDIEKYMQLCDVLIACSYREGLGMNVIEALLCGKPVVASRNRGHNELIREGENGYIVNPPDNANGFAKKVLRIITHPKGLTVDSILSAQPYTVKNVDNELRSIYELRV